MTLKIEDIDPKEDIRMTGAELRKLLIEARVDELEMALEASKADNFPTDMLEVCSWIIKRLTTLSPDQFKSLIKELDG